MPKIAKPLTAIEISRLEAPGLVSVGGVAGLALQITKTGTRSWVLRTKFGTKRHDIGLGAYPGVTLAHARRQAAELREQILAGSDPLQQRREAKAVLRATQAAALTFEQAADRAINKMRAEWKNPKSEAQWRASLATYAFPAIGKLDVRLIEQRHIEALLEPIWETKTETASRVRGRIEKILDWCIAGRHIKGENPARWHGLLSMRLSAPGKVAKKKHHPAVPLDRAHSFWRDLRGREGPAARALEFVLLTAARSGEVRGATWGEIDMVKGVWTVPDERMKAGREHRVPLSSAALELLRNLPRLEGNDLVFPAPRGGVLSDMSLTAVMRRMGLDEVPHGLRSTFRDWAGERTNYPRELAEAALAHTNKDKVEAAYRRGDALEKRRGLMEAWAKFLQTPPAVGTVLVSTGTRAA
jgi:integrase